jgi:hypothetical protein
MRVPDNTLIVSAILRLAEENGSANIAPGQVTSYLSEQFGSNLALHTVSEIMIDMGLVTHKVGNNRYLIWDEEKMSKLKVKYIVNVEEKP